MLKYILTIKVIKIVILCKTDHLELGSRFGFLFSLVYVFADGIAPPGTFFHVKLALMLSLMATDQEPKVCNIEFGIDNLLLVSNFVFIITAEQLFTFVDIR